MANLIRNDFNAQKAIAQGKSAIASGVNTAKKKLGMQPPAPPPPPKPKKRAMIGAAFKKVGSGVGKIGGSVGRGIASGGKAIGQELKARKMAKQATSADDNFIKHATGLNQQRTAQKKAGIGLASARKAASVPDAQFAKAERKMAKQQAKIHKNAMKSIRQSHLDQARRSLRGDSSPLLREDAPRGKVGGRCGKGWQDGPSGKCIRAGKSGLGYGQIGPGVGGKAKWLAKSAVMGSGDVEYNRRRSLGQSRQEAFVHGYASGIKGGLENIAMGSGAGGSVYRRSRNAGQGRLRSAAKGVGTSAALYAALGAGAAAASNALSKKKGKAAQESESLSKSAAAQELPGGSSPQPKKRSSKIMMRPRPESVAGREALGRIAVKKMIDGSKKRGDSYGFRRRPRNDSYQLAR